MAEMEGNVSSDEFSSTLQESDFGLRRVLASLGGPVGERANVATNGLGLLVSIFGSVAVLSKATTGGDLSRLAACGVFAAALIATYLASTLSHSFVRPGPRRLFRTLDQAVIYLLIVGTFTPFAVAYLQSTAWQLFLAAMWAFALWGFTMKLVLRHRIDSVTLWSYVLLGWMPIAPFFYLWGVAPMPMLGWVLAGGLAYTFGTLFFIRDDARFHCHAIWHTFAMLGSACHLVAVYYYVA